MNSSDAIASLTPEQRIKLDEACRILRTPWQEGMLAALRASGHPLFPPAPPVDPDEAQAERRIVTVRDHVAVLGWYVKSTTGIPNGDLTLKLRGTFAGALRTARAEGRTSADADAVAKVARVRECVGNYYATSTSLRTALLSIIDGK